MIHPKLPADVAFIISRLVSLGHSAHIVGGCVRDHILGSLPHDYDITTSAFPDEILVAFSDHRTLDVGIKHGTVTVIRNGEQYEITTYRMDGEYLDHRHPSEVSFTKKLSEDLSRRDFTMNAIVYNEEDGFVDLHNGIDDISNGIIRAIGVAADRFEEDALRILRGLRFSAVLGFEIEEATAKAIFEKTHLLKDVSRERVLVEWKKLIAGKNAYRVISEYKSVIGFVIPELSDIKLPGEELFMSLDPLMRELSLYYFASPTPAEAYSKACFGLKTDTQSRKNGQAVLSAITSYGAADEYEVKKMLSLIGKENAEIAIDLGCRLGIYERESLAMLSGIIDREEPYSISMLDINGAEIMGLGIKGPGVGKTLSALLDLVIRGKTENKKAALIAAISSGEINNGI